MLPCPCRKRFTTTDRDLDAGIAAAGFDAASSASTIIRAARGLFDESPFRQVTVGQIAQAAGLNEVTVYRIFGSKDAVAAACWLGNVEKLRRGIGNDQKATADPLERIRRYLKRLIQVAKQDAAITDAMLLAVQAQTIERGSKIADLDPRAILLLPQLLEPLVAAGQKEGVVTESYSSIEIAAFMTNAVLLRDDAKERVCCRLRKVRHRHVAQRSR